VTPDDRHAGLLASQDVKLLVPKVTAGLERQLTVEQRRLPLGPAPARPTGDAEAEFERTIRRRIAARLRQAGVDHYLPEIFRPGSDTPDARSAELARTLIENIARWIEDLEGD
jgi:hypothetical protein